MRHLIHALLTGAFALAPLAVNHADASSAADKADIGKHAEADRPKPAPTESASTTSRR